MLYFKFSFAWFIYYENTLLQSTRCRGPNFPLNFSQTWSFIPLGTGARYIINGDAAAQTKVIGVLRLTETFTELLQNLCGNIDVVCNAETSYMNFFDTFYVGTLWNCRSRWPRRLRRRSATARLLRSWVRIPPGAWMFVCCECCQVEVSATSWSLVQRSPTDCGASLCVI